MGQTAFEVELGTAQGRVPRAAGAPGSGDFAVVLGHARPGVFAALETGAAVELAQEVVLSGAHLATARVWMRGPSTMPVGAAWRLQWLIEGVAVRALAVPIGRALAAELSAVVADLAGPHTLALRLSLEGVSAPAEVELPGVWLDELVLAATGRPSLVNPRPVPGERGVPRTTDLALELVDPSGAGVDPATTRVWVDGAPAVDAGIVTAAFAGPGASVAPAGRSLLITLAPRAPFPSQAFVTVRVAITTQDGLAHLDTAYTFEVEDRTSPTLLAAFRRDPRQLELVFDEPVTTTGATQVQLRPDARPAVAPEATDVVADGVRLRAHLDRAPSPSVRYLVEVAGVADLSGNVISPPFDRTWLAPVNGAAGRLDLWRLLPAHLRRADARGDLRAFLACLLDVTDLLLAEGDRWLDLIDLTRAPEPFLDQILADLGDPFPFALDVLGKRRLAASLVALYRRKGTAPGIEQALRFFFGLGARAVPYASRGGRLGIARLGRDLRLGASDSFRAYAFDLEVDRVLTDDERRQVRWLVDYGKPAHTHLVQIREPLPPQPRARWRLGVGALRHTTTLATA